MENKIKLIWDFFGSHSKKTAEHYEIHLKEFLNSINYPLVDTGIENVSENHFTAYILVYEKDMIMFRDKLKPNRGEKI
jgi:hypothetical protein